MLILGILDRNKALQMFFRSRKCIQCVLLSMSSCKNKPTALCKRLGTNHIFRSRRLSRYMQWMHTGGVNLLLKGTTSVLSFYQTFFSYHCTPYDKPSHMTQGEICEQEDALCSIFNTVPTLIMRMGIGFDMDCVWFIFCILTLRLDTYFTALSRCFVPLKVFYTVMSLVCYCYHYDPSTVFVMEMWPENKLALAPPPRFHICRGYLKSFGFLTQFKCGKVMETWGL